MARLPLDKTFEPENRTEALKCVEDVLLSLASHISTYLGADYGPYDLRDKVFHRLKKHLALGRSSSDDYRETVKSIAVGVIRDERRAMDRRFKRFTQIDTENVTRVTDPNALRFFADLHCREVAKEMIETAPPNTKPIIEYLAYRKDDEISCAELASALGIPRTTVYKRLERYKEKYRNRFLRVLFGRNQ